MTWEMGESFEKSLDDERPDPAHKTKGIEIRIPMGSIELIRCQSRCFTGDMDTICGLMGLCTETKSFVTGDAP